MNKKILLASTAILFSSVTAFTQNTTNATWYANAGSGDAENPKQLYYDVHGAYKQPVNKEKLEAANFLRDFIPGYPTNWISNYVSVEMSTTTNGRVMKAKSADDRISPEQKNILQMTDLGTEIVVNVRHTSRNSVTDAIEECTMHLSMTVIPETEAQFAGGYQKMSRYLKDNIIDKIEGSLPKEFEQGKVKFTVNEAGDIVNAKISRSSGNLRTDKLILEEIQKMPRWKPAENSKGMKVKQEFEFRVGMDGC